MILDYSGFLEDYYDSGISGKIDPTNPILFFGRRDFCRFCQLPIPQVYPARDAPPRDLSLETSHWTEVWSCPNCSWWNMEHHYADDWIYFRQFRYAILRSFQPHEIGLPVDALRIHLQRYPDDLYRIHSTKMEQLVQSVFEDFFECEVIHCGKSHDGGIDLILVSAEKPALIQVKRRSNPASPEPVTTIRHLSGAMLLQQSQHGIVVSTADHFSAEAEAAAARSGVVGLFV